MIAFARAIAKSWVARLTPQEDQYGNIEVIASRKSRNLISKQIEQNKRFIEVTKNGGMWFS